MTDPTSTARPETPQASAAVAQSRTGPWFTNRRRALPLGRAREEEHYHIDPNLTRASHAHAYERKPGEPLYRPLRIYALDPSASRRDGAIAVVNVPYEKLTAGPTGELLQVQNGRISDDETGQLNVDDQFVLLSEGRTPSPSDPLFWSQMVYAVCSTTYAAFLHALGRDLAWGFTRRADGNERLIIRPAVEDFRNAFYDRDTGELRFGVYTADAKVSGLNLPRGTVCTCLSHDVVVHETTHALLDGLRSQFKTPTNADVMAFHEAFADLVAIFQRFTYKDVVAAGITQSRGSMRGAELLTRLALQFGQTIGLTGALRNAVAGTSRRYGDSEEPHRRGEVLVAAVFEAFASVYERKTSRLVRLATQGSGVLPPGSIPVELADALTERACKLASQFLSICIRAIDYCPPVDITFGEYLRALITADYELVPDDDWGYREALIEGFRKYDIFPGDVTNLSEDALLWRPSDQPIPPEPELGFDRLQFSGDPAHPAGEGELLRQARALGGLVADPRYASAFGLCPNSDIEGDKLDLPVIHSIRSARRVGPDGQVVFDLVAEVTQRREVRAHAGISGFDFYGGSTVVLDPVGTVRYVIRKSLTADDRLARQRAMLASESQFWGIGPGNRMYPESNAFRLLHSVVPRDADRRRLLS